jgi:hypothetical protein
MKKSRFSRRLRRLGAPGMLAVLFACSAASPALAGNKFNVATTALSAAATTSSVANCTTPPLSTPFAPYGDTNLYALVPGQVFDGFGASGWTLTGGATIQTTTLADGTRGSVLDLPAGSTAVSPGMCVQSDYPTARVMVRDVAQDQPASLFATYPSSGDLVSAGKLNGQSTWSPSAVYKTHPGTQSGWQLVQFGFIAGARTGDTQIYNFFVDPRMTS